MERFNKIQINLKEIELLDTIDSDDCVTIRNKPNQGSIKNTNKRRLTLNSYIEQQACERLYSNAIDVKNRKTEAIQEQIKTEVSKYSFKPELNSTSIELLQNKSNEYLPIHQRYPEVINKSKEKITQIKNQLHKPMTHIPSINKLKLSNKQDNVNKVPVYERLYKDSKRNLKINIQNNESLTFQQNTYNNKKPYNNNKTTNEHFLKRQDDFLARSSNYNKHLHHYYQYIENSNCTFQPNISSTNTSDYSQKIKAQRNNETLNEKITRLNKKKLSHSSSYNYYLPNQQSQFTFSPKINNDYISDNKKFFQDYYEAKKMIRENHSTKNNEVYNNQSEYKYINPLYDNVESQYKNDGLLMKRIEKDLMKKQEYIKFQQDEKIKDEMKECTFSPEIIPMRREMSFEKLSLSFIPSYQQQIVEQDIYDYAKWKKKIRDKKENEENRKKQIFLYDNYKSNIKGRNTKTKPFNITPISNPNDYTYSSAYNNKILRKILSDM